MSERPRTLLWAGLGAREIAARFATAPDFDLIEARDRDAFIEALPQARIIAMPGHFCSPELLRQLDARAGKLGFLQLLTAGYELLEQHGAPAGVTVATASPAMAPTVAEHAVALLLALARRLPDFHRLQQARRWDRGDATRLRSLNGMRIVILGFGGIGRAAAERLKGFGAHIVVVSRTLEASPVADEILRPQALQAALAGADAVILALPYTEANHHLLDARSLAWCKPGAFVVNVARGRLIDTDAMVQALQDGRIGGFATDVAELEPLTSEAALWAAPNTLITPHAAGADGQAGFHRLADFAAANIGRFLRGETPESLIALPQAHPSQTLAEAAS